MALDLPRRDFLRGMLAVAAPAIVHAANIMPVKALLSNFDFAMDTNGYIDHLSTSFAVDKEIFAANVFNHNLANIREVLLPGVRQFVSRYEKWPELQWPELFDA